MSDTFCPLPWMHIATKNDGSIRGCCEMGGKGNKDSLYRKNNNETYNIRSDNVSDAMNSEKAKKIRSMMINGEKPDECYSCWTNENNNVKSKRQLSKEKWSKYLDYNKAKEITDNDGKLNEFNILFLDLRLGNFCNLKCRMCGPHNSTTWYDDWKDLTGRDYFVYSNKRYSINDKQEFNWYNNDELWGNFRNVENTIKEINFIGGEPTLIDEVHQFLLYLVDNNKSDIKIRYNTNLTNIQTKMKYIWENIKHIEINVSIDGYSSVNDYIRFPSNWNKIEENIKVIHELIENKNANIDMNMVPTIQIYNIFDIPNLIDWKINNGFYYLSRTNSKNPFFINNILYYPDYLSIKILPYKTKLKVEEFYKNYIDEFIVWVDNLKDPKPYFNVTNHDFNDFYKDFIKSNINKQLQGILNVMWDKDETHLLPKFADYTKKLDEIRNQNFKETFPVLYNELIDYF